MQAYEDACQRAGVVDFAELLLRAFELWRDNPEVARALPRRFRHVLVDEFQDTNAIQYAWLKLLTGSDGIPFVVGDDDQSIYAGAARASRTCSSSARLSRRSCAASSRTTARPATS
jgi:superfamily I DNA/RNA helicase